MELDTPSEGAASGMERGSVELEASGCPTTLRQEHTGVEANLQPSLLDSSSVFARAEAKLDGINFVAQPFSGQNENNNQSGDSEQPSKIAIVGSEPKKINEEVHKASNGSKIAKKAERKDRDPKKEDVEGESLSAEAVLYDRASQATEEPKPAEELESSSEPPRETIADNFEKYYRRRSVRALLRQQQKELEEEQERKREGEKVEEAIQACSGSETSFGPRTKGPRSKWPAVVQRSDTGVKDSEPQVDLTHGASSKLNSDEIQHPQQRLAEGGVEFNSLEQQQTKTTEGKGQYSGIRVAGQSVQQVAGKYDSEKETAGLTVDLVGNEGNGKFNPHHGIVRKRSRGRPPKETAELTVNLVDPHHGIVRKRSRGRPPRAHASPDRTPLRPMSRRLRERMTAEDAQEQEENTKQEPADQHDSKPVKVVFSQARPQRSRGRPKARMEDAASEKDVQAAIDEEIAKTLGPHKDTRNVKIRRPKVMVQKPETRETEQVDDSERKEGSKRRGRKRKRKVVRPIDSEDYKENQLLIALVKGKRVGVRFTFAAVSRDQIIGSEVSRPGVSTALQTPTRAEKHPKVMKNSRDATKSPFDFEDDGRVEKRLIFTRRSPAREPASPDRVTRAIRKKTRKLKLGISSRHSKSSQESPKLQEQQVLEASVKMDKGHRRSTSQRGTGRTKEGTHEVCMDNAAQTPSKEQQNLIVDDQVVKPKRGRGRPRSKPRPEENSENRPEEVISENRVKGAAEAPSAVDTIDRVHSNQYTAQTPLPSLWLLNNADIKQSRMRIRERERRAKIELARLKAASAKQQRREKQSHSQTPAALESSNSRNQLADITPVDSGVDCVARNRPRRSRRRTKRFIDADVESTSTSKKTDGEAVKPDSVPSKASAEASVGENAVGEKENQQSNSEKDKLDQSIQEAVDDIHSAPVSALMSSFVWDSDHYTDAEEDDEAMNRPTFGESSRFVKTDVRVTAASGKNGCLNRLETLQQGSSGLQSPIGLASPSLQEPADSHESDNRDRDDGSGKTRRAPMRRGASRQQNQLRTGLAGGYLDPHLLVSCGKYRHMPSRRRHQKSSYSARSGNDMMSPVLKRKGSFTDESSVSGSGRRDAASLDSLTQGELEPNQAIKNPTPTMTAHRDWNDSSDGRIAKSDDTGSALRIVAPKRDPNGEELLLHDEKTVTAENSFCSPMNASSGHSSPPLSPLSHRESPPHLSENYVKPSSPTAAVQPFRVCMNPEAAFLCDLHAHLASVEIIGFLGGKWDPLRKIVYIQAAFPCRSLETEDHDGKTDVEMDPVSEMEVREVIQRRNMDVVGWYHSHPTFQPDPSVRDIDNQRDYQALFRDANGVEPFVGLIVGTYGQQNPGLNSILRFFHVREEKISSRESGQVHIPMLLAVKFRRKNQAPCPKQQTQPRGIPGCPPSMYAEVASTLKLKWAVGGPERSPPTPAPQSKSDLMDAQLSTILKCNGVHVPKSSSVDEVLSKTHVTLVRGAGTQSDLDKRACGSCASCVKGGGRRKAGAPTSKRLLAQTSESLIHEGSSPTNAPADEEETSNTAKEHRCYVQNITRFAPRFQPKLQPQRKIDQRDASVQTVESVLAMQIKKQESVATDSAGTEASSSSTEQNVRAPPSSVDDLNMEVGGATLALGESERSGQARADPPKTALSEVVDRGGMDANGKAMTERHPLKHNGPSGTEASLKGLDAGRAVESAVTLVGASIAAPSCPKGGGGKDRNVESGDALDLTSNRDVASATPEKEPLIQTDEPTSDKPKDTKNVKGDDKEIVWAAAGGGETISSSEYVEARAHRGATQETEGSATENHHADSIVANANHEALTEVGGRALESQAATFSPLDDAPRLPEDSRTRVVRTYGQRRSIRGVKRRYDDTNEESATSVISPKVEVASREFVTMVDELSGNGSIQGAEHTHSVLDEDKTHAIAAEPLESSSKQSIPRVQSANEKAKKKKRKKRRVLGLRKRKFPKRDSSSSKETSPPQEQEAIASEHQQQRSDIAQEGLSPEIDSGQTPRKELIKQERVATPTTTKRRKSRTTPEVSSSQSLRNRQLAVFELDKKKAFLALATVRPELGSLALQSAHLVDYYAAFPMRMSMHVLWKGSVPRLAKMKISLRRWLLLMQFPVEDVDEFTEALSTYLETTWAHSRLARPHARSNKAKKGL